MTDDELKSAATRAGIVDLDALRMVDTTNVADPKAFIAELKKAKPYLFAKSARDMSDAEFKAARQRAVRQDLNTTFAPKTFMENVREMTAEAFEAAKARLGLRNRPQSASFRPTKR